MPRFLALFFSLLLVFIGTGTLAQNNGQLQPGDPPVASLIEISPPDENGVVTITGAPGSVFPSAQIAIRNLYTEQLTYVQAGVTGAFSGRIFGPGNTPFWISPATSIPPVMRDRPGSMPGGPGTIIYGSLPSVDGAASLVTQIVIDGVIDDWEAFPQAQLVETTGGVIYGLRNTESLYVALEPQTLPGSYWKLQVIFTLEGATYRLSLDPRLPEEAATLQDVSPVERDRGTVGVSKTQAEVVEMRIPLESLRSVLGAAVETASLERLEFVAADGSALLSIPVQQALPLLEGEVDGIVHSSQLDASSRFTMAGPAVQGAGVWSAECQISQLQLAPGDELQMRMDVTLNVPALPESLAGVSMVGVLRMQPVSGPDGAPVTGGLNSNNGWSAVLTPSGLAIDNLRSDFLLGETIVPAPQVVRRGESLIFGMDFDLTLPETLPAGMYTLVFEGYGQIADGERFRWDSSGLLGTGPGISRVRVNRLPVVLTIGEPDTPRLVWSLFQDMPSEGSRGLLSEQDQERVALSNRVRFNSPTYILPPINPATDALQPYPLEPYLINQLPNAYDSTAAPLIPLLLPNGQFEVSVTRPNGSVQNFERTSLLQNQLSTQAQDERTRFGAQSQVDVYRLTTLDPALTDYVFDQYGLYTIEMTGTVDDVWGNTYEGGGTYEVLVAELMDLLPGVLPGAPFEVGDTFQAGLTLLPGVAADVTINARIYPLDGGPVIEHEISGQANRYGYFVGEGFEFTTPGEYVVDYEARFTDSQGRLWAASTRSAGVIANQSSTLIAHGRRGLDGYHTSAFRPAWFTTSNYGPVDGPYRLNFPFHSGDVMWYVSDSGNTVKPGITVQDTSGEYAAWASGTLVDSPASDGSSVAQQAIRGELPVYMVSGSQPGYNPVTQAGMLVNDAYTYLSVVRPGVTVRQFVLGTNDDSLPVYWDMDDPYNEQIGSGLTGDREGDFVFMFGGAVVRNEAAGVAETAIYGATAFVTASGFEAPGARVYPPYRGAAGGADGGPLLTVRDVPVTMFFHPTGLRPGQVLEVGDTLSIAGHVAPALASEVSVTLISPSGERRDFAGLANAIGYYYDPENDFVVDEPGIWTADITVRHNGLSSAGVVESPYPEGGVLGAEGGRFSVYVVPENAPQLTWSDTREDIPIPGGLPFNLQFDVPDGWMNPIVEHTVTTPGYIIRSGPLNLSGMSFSFQYNPTDLNATFPNIEVDARLDGPAGSDPVSMTFAVTDENGQIRIRTFTILYDRLLTLES